MHRGSTMMAANSRRIYRRGLTLSVWNWKKWAIACKEDVMLDKVFEALNAALAERDNEIDYLRGKVAELERKYEPEPDKNEERS